MTLSMDATTTSRAFRPAGVFAHHTWASFCEAFRFPFAAACCWVLQACRDAVPRSFGAVFSIFSSHGSPSCSSHSYS